LKFPKEARFSFGVCVRKNADGVEEGIRLPFFNYTGKKIVTMQRYEKLVIDELSRVNAIPRGEKRELENWAGYKQRKKGDIWENDKLTYLQGIGPVKAAKLSSVGINSINDLKNTSDEEVKSIALVTKQKPSVIFKWREATKLAKPGDSEFPKYFDHIEGNDNPYIAKYGLDNWKESMKTKSSKSGLKDYVCVTDLVTHIDRETRLAYADTEYRDTYMWSHDALCQMYDDKCVEWMKENDLYKRWVKPELGLNDIVEVTMPNGEVKKRKHYANRPVGDQPELMPHDSSLNWDVECSNNMHVILTSHLPYDDKRKIRKDTPNEIVKAITKLCHPVTGVVPTSRRIIEDVYRVVHCLKEIVKAGGGVVPNLVNRNGYRRMHGTGKKWSERKGVTTIADMEAMGLLPEVQEIAKEFCKKERDTFESIRQVPV
jgi:predicted flap endonuclease-1-like 5' DNA nuclease